MSRFPVVNRLVDAVYGTVMRVEWRLRAARSVSTSAGVRPPDRKRRLLMLPNVRGWAFDDLCQQRARHMESTWTTDIQYLDERPVIDPSQYDLMFNPNWTYGTYDKMFAGRYVRGMNSHKWQRSRLPYRELRHCLRGAVGCFVPNQAQVRAIQPSYAPTFLVKEGVDPRTFFWVADRHDRDLVVGWSGNPTNRMKRLDTVIKPVCARAGVELRVASDLTRDKLNLFYNDVDLVLIASESEGNPLSLFEAGACGRAVLATNVGCVPEIVEDGVTGFVVESTFDVDQTLQAFVDRLRWCKDHVTEVRAMGKLHRERVLAERTVDKTCESFRQAIEWAYRLVR